MIPEVEGHSGVSERSHGLAQITQEAANRRQGTNRISLPTATYVCQGRLPSPCSLAKELNAQICSQMHLPLILCSALSFRPCLPVSIGIIKLDRGSEISSHVR